MTVWSYCGAGKPPNVNDLLKQTISRLTTLLYEGIKVGNVCTTVCLASVVYDTPARAFIRQVKLPIGHYGFNKCIQHDLYNGKRVTYLNVRSKSRGDCSFRLKKYSGLHTGVPSFLTLTIVWLPRFPIDYMYKVILGVLKSMCDIWLYGPRVSPNRLVLSSVEKLGRCITSFQRYTRCHFQRLCRHVDDVQRWEAMEFSSYMTCMSLGFVDGWCL